MPSGKGKGGKSDSIRLSVHQILTSALVAGVTGISANPTGVTGRVLTEADAWAHFRWRSFHFRLHRVGTVTSVQVASWVGGVQDANPSTIAQAAELLPSTVLAGTATVPSPWVRVGAVDRSGPFPWYKAIPGTADPTEEAPGLISIAGTGTETFFIEIRAVIEFKTGVAAGNTPEELALRARIREIRLERERALARNALIRVLQPSPMALNAALYGGSVSLPGTQPNVLPGL